VTAADAPAGDALDPEVALDRLGREGVLHRDAQGRHLFRHPMLRAAIEEAIPAARRRRLHEIVLGDLLSRAGPGTSRAVIARHADRCGAHQEAFTNHFLLAEQARAAHSELVADEHYTAALAHLADEDVRRGAVFAGRAKVRSRVQRFSDALQDLHASYPHAEAARDHRALVELLLEEATIHDWRDTWQAGADLVARAAPLVQQSGDARLRARWLMALGRTRFREGKLEPAAIHLSEAHAIAGKVEDHETWAIAGMLLGHVMVSTERLDEAESLLGAVIASCERAHDNLHLCSAYNNRIWLWLKRESLERAIADQRRATALAREIGHVQLERSCTYNLAEFLYWRGELAEALELARRARDLQTRFLDEVPIDALLVARISLARGELSIAREELDWVLARCPEDHRSPLVDTQIRMVELMVRTARPDASESWRGLVDRARRIRSIYYELHEVVHFAATEALRDRRLDDARRYVDEGARLAGPAGVWRERFARLRQALEGSSSEAVASL
jgi:eukaryotic-like serine/threonine-protein kinase